MNKNIFLALGTLGSIVVPIATIISCNKGDEKKDEDSKITNINKYKDLKIKDDAKELKTVLITDSGRTDDKSFNQSAYEAMNALKEQIDMKKGKVIQPQNVDKLEESYETALKAGYNVWILPGFNHVSHIFKFYKENKNKMSNVTIIGIDFGNSTNIAAENKPKDIVTISKMYGLNYNTHEAAYLAGVAAAKYLVLSEDASPTVGTFGGGDFAGVTKFNHGFLEGVLAYDKKDTEHDIKYAGTDIDLGTGFSDTNKFKAATLKLVNEGADIILPVAGPATGSVLSESDKVIVGVDVDQRNSYKDKAERFLTSIQKGVGQSTYDALVSIFTNKKVMDKGTQTKGIDAKWTSITTSSPKTDLYKQAIEYANTDEWKTKAKKTWQRWRLILKKEMTGGNVSDLKSIITQINKDNGGA